MVQRLQGLLPEHIDRRHKGMLSWHLNPDKDAALGMEKNWRGLAEQCKLNPQFIDSLERMSDPTLIVIEEWNKKQPRTIGKLLDILLILERYDVLNDDKFLQHIQSDVELYEADLETELEELEEGHNTLLLVSDVSAILEGDSSQQYNALVCYDPADEEFIKLYLLKVLENDKKHKLLITDRDILVGWTMNSAKAEVMQSRCDKIILVISDAYLKASNLIDEDDLKLALAIKPHDVIVLKIDNCKLPTALAVKHMTISQLSRSEATNSIRWTQINSVFEYVSVKRRLNYLKSLTEISEPTTAIRICKETTDESPSSSEVTIKVCSSNDTSSKSQQKPCGLDQSGEQKLSDISPAESVEPTTTIRICGETTTDSPSTSGVTIKVCSSKDSMSSDSRKKSDPIAKISICEESNNKSALSDGVTIKVSEGSDRTNKKSSDESNKYNTKVQVCISDDQSSYSDKSTPLSVKPSGINDESKSCTGVSGEAGSHSSAQLTSVDESSNNRPTNDICISEDSSSETTSNNNEIINDQTSNIDNIEGSSTHSSIESVTYHRLDSDSTHEAEGVIVSTEKGPKHISLQARILNLFYCCICKGGTNNRQNRLK